MMEPGHARQCSDAGVSGWAKAITVVCISTHAGAFRGIVLPENTRSAMNSSGLRSSRPATLLIDFGQKLQSMSGVLCAYSIIGLSILCASKDIGPSPLKTDGAAHLPTSRTNASILVEGFFIVLRLQYRGK